jgi:outer membrane lipase/esterase
MDELHVSVTAAWRRALTSAASIRICDPSRASAIFAAYQQERHLMARFVRSTLAAAATAFALGPGTASAQFSNVYFFGDSLTDSGSYKPLLPPGVGLFTTNPGPVWSQLFAQRYGFAAIPANQGGTNFAMGGARVADLPGVPANPPTGTGVPIAVQMATLAAAGPLDANAVYSVWGGANDVFFQLGLAGSGAITPTQAQANLGVAAATLAHEVGVLNAAGARYVVVFNLPDIGITPAGRASGQAPLLTGASRLFNSVLFGALDQQGTPTLRVNIAALFAEAVANPAAFGLVDVTTPACGTTPSLLCTPANFVAPNAAQTFLFADGVHPTSAGHAIIAQTVESMIEGPMKIGVLAEAPLAVERSTFRAIDSRMFSALDTPVSRSRWEAWVSYDYSRAGYGGNFVSGHADVNTIAAGGDYKLSDRALIGANSGGYKLRETTGTVYGGYGMGPWYVGATLGAGDLDFHDVHRDFDLGALRRSERGDTHGWHAMASVLGGYWFSYADVLHGPFARLSYQDIRVKGFAENGSDSTALAYGEQRRESFVSTLGWQVAGKFANVRPFARIGWSFEGHDRDRFVSASSVTLGGNYSMPVLGPDRSYAQYLVGASADFGAVTGYVTGSATSGKSDGNDYGVTVGVRVPL